MPEDVIIIGSGFGAAVIAARFSERLGRDAKIVVVEKGADHTGAFDPDANDDTPLNTEGNRFRQTYSPDYLGHVGDLFRDVRGAYRAGQPSFSVIAGRGIGGGSNLYCGVSLRTPAALFDRVEPETGRRYWPEFYSRDRLNGAYSRAEDMLRVRQMQWTDDAAPHWQLATKRDLAFAEGARRIGATAVPLKLADENDANEGWWTQGQRFSGRQNLSQNYLARAKANGVRFQTNCEVEEILPRAGGGYVVRGVDRRRGERAFELECKILVLGAGTVGTCALLLRSQPNFQGARALDQAQEESRSPLLGRRISGNGDYGVTGLVGRGFERDVDGHKGKPMSSFSPSFWREHRFILIPFHTPPLYFAQQQISSLLPPKFPTATGRGSTGPAEDPQGNPVQSWGRGYKERLQLFTSRQLTMGCLCWDEGEGEVQLSVDGTRAEVLWRETHPDTEARWNTALTAMRRIYEALGGEMFLDGYRAHGSVNTAHPLGGVRMANDDEPLDGLVNSLGESFSNPNLFVVDGSILPSALGVNPSLTIAAVAETIADRLIRGEGTLSLRDRLDT